MAPARERSRTASRRVPVPCCVCGRPTSMRVPPALLEEVEILHLCAGCARLDLPQVEDPAGRS